MFDIQEDELIHLWDMYIDKMSIILCRRFSMSEDYRNLDFYKERIAEISLALKNIASTRVIEYTTTVNNYWESA